MQPEAVASATGNRASLFRIAPAILEGVPLLDGLRDGLHIGAVLDADPNEAGDLATEYGP